MITKNRRALALIGSLLLALVLLVAFGAGCQAPLRAPPTPEPPLEALGVQKFFRNAYFKGDVEVAENLIVGGYFTTTAAVLNLGNQITDNVYVWAQMRTWDGSDNLADVPIVDDLDQANGWQSSYNVMGWGPEATTFQALFAHTQIAASMLTTQTVYGLEGKVTLNGAQGSGNAAAIGLLGKVTTDVSATLPIAYPVYSLVETITASDTITSSVNYYADLANSGLITTSRILYTDAVTWTYGIDLSNAVLTTADIVLSNGESIVNSADGVITLTATTVHVAADLDITGTLELEDVVVSGPITFGSDPVTAHGELIAHGLGTTPTAVILTPISVTLASSTTVAVGATNAISFTVQITPSHVSEAIGVYWMAGK